MLWQWANNRLQVFILDLDGTLIPSAEIDNQCYWRAVFECFEVQGNTPGLDGFKHVTDSGILGEWCTRKIGRQPNSDETHQIRQRFLHLLEQAESQQPRDFHPIPGVEDWLAAVNEDSRVFTGIATGGWGHTARLKLQLSGLDRYNLPLASSDDAISRTEIMQIAAREVCKPHPPLETDFIYVGDGAWDLQASQELGWKFIGIAHENQASGNQAKRLRQAGAEHILADFKRAESGYNSSTTQAHTPGY